MCKWTFNAYNEGKASVRKKEIYADYVFLKLVTFLFVSKQLSWELFKVLYVYLTFGLFLFEVLKFSVFICLMSWSQHIFFQSSQAGVS